MSERGFSVRLSANVDQYVAAMAKARAATASISAESVKNMEKLGGQMQRAGATMTRSLTLPIVALGAGLVAATVSWESAFTGVTKTVDGTAQQLERLEGDLRSMARSLPASHKEIAAVAEAAGQLGVKTDDVASFTKVMIDLGETTNLTADEAATSIAQLMNVMGTAPEDVTRLGSALVELGNNGASTERDIIQMAQRISGAGEVIGLSESEVLGFANALASVGIEVEAGGSAISRVMMDMAKASATGGKELNLFASTAGMTATEFARAFQADPAAAIVQFVDGLGRISEEGGNVFGLLDQIGLSDIRVSRALLTMAESGDLLANSLRDGESAWESNTALATEAEKRYATSAAQLSVLRNQIVDVAIDIGGLLVPMMLDVVGAVAGAVRWFGDLPEPVQKVALGFLAIVAAAGPLISIAGTIVKNFMLIKSVLGSVGGFLAANPYLAIAAAGAAALGVVAVALMTHKSESEIAAARARDFYAAVQDGLSTLDAQALALTNASDAAGKYASSILSGVDKDLIDTLTNAVPDEDLKRQSKYVDVMRELGVTLDEVTQVNRGGAIALAELEKVRRRALDTGLQEIVAAQSINGVYLTEAQKIAAVNAAREEYIRTGRVTVEGAALMTGAYGSLNQAGAEFIGVLEAQAGAAYDSAEAAANLVRIGDDQAYLYLKGTGQLNLLTEAEIAAAEAHVNHALAMRELPPHIKDLEAATSGLSGASDELGGALELTDEQIKANADAAKRLQTATSNVKTEFEMLASAADILQSALDQVFGGPAGEERAWNAYEAGIVGVNEAIKENGTTLDRHTEKGRANREAFLDQLDTISELGVAMVRNGASTDEAAGAVNLMTEALVGQMVQAGMSEEAARGFIDEMNRTPTDVETAMNVVVDEQTKTEITELLEQMGTIDAGAEAEITALLNRGSFDEALRLVQFLSRGMPLELWLNAKQNAGGNGIYHSAAGRYVPAGANLVSTFGEEGPEAILPLDKPGRLRELLSDPRILGPIMRSLGRTGVGSGESMSGPAAPSPWGQIEQASMLAPFTVSPATPGAAGGTSVDRTMANRFERGDVTAAEYDKYLADRQAGMEKFSDEEQAIHRIRQGLIDDEKRAKDDELRAERDRMQARFELGEISLADYQAYLNGLLGSFEQYSTDYTAVFGEIRQINADVAAEQKKAVDEAANAAKQALEDQFAAAKAQQELIDATTAANDASATYTSAATKSFLYGRDKKRTPEERAQAAEEAANAAKRVAETALRRADAEANATGLADGTAEWARSVRSALEAGSEWSAANGRGDVAAAIDNLLVGIPVMGTGGKVNGTGAGTILRAGENNSSEWILRDRQIAALVLAAGHQPWSPAGSRGASGAGSVDLGGITARVYVGSREITDIVRTEIEMDNRDTAARLMAGAR